MVGGLEFEKNDEVKRRVLDSNFNEMICRLGKLTPINTKLNEVKFQYLTNFHQLRFQLVFLNLDYLILYQESF